MIDRICISINNRCNLRCRYCHFHEKGPIGDVPMDVYEILDHVKAYTNQKFKIGFVGDGEAFLDFDKLRSYITKSDSGISGRNLRRLISCSDGCSEDTWKSIR